MTHEQYSTLAHPSSVDDPVEHIDEYHHAPFDTTTMSTDGLLENYFYSSHRLSGDWLVQPDEELEGAATGGQSTPLEESAPAPVTFQPQLFTSRHTQTPHDECYSEHRPTKRARLHFHEFAAQARQHQHHECRKRFLSERRRVLQKSVALSARLRRTSAWVQDGLVEVSKHQDPKTFAQVFSHVQDLVDICYSHWNNDLNCLDASQASLADLVTSHGPPPFFDQLPQQAQKDLLDLLTNLRSNPQFLIDRFKSLPRSQVAVLTSSPKWEFSDAFLQNLSQDSSRSASQRKRRQLHAYSKELEDYATSFERSNPLSLLLHNLYAHDALPESPESKLRLYNWSTICAELLQSASDSYSSLYWQVLEAFSVMQDWPAKTRIELFLMDVLQKGAFLINDSTLHKARPGFNPLNTDQARKFFDESVHELYWTLIDCRSGCYPSGALALAKAILGKLPSERQGDYRNHFFAEWYLGHFMRTAIMFPENENMLLKMHVSKRARDHILAPIYNRLLYKFENHQSPITESDETVRNIIEDMVGMLDGELADDPYVTNNTARSNNLPSIDDPSSMLVVCASEIVKVLETLSPQAIHSAYSSDLVMQGMQNAFKATYSRPNTRFDMLKQQLLQLIEPGTSAKDIHPCSEAWSELSIDFNGAVSRFKASLPPVTLDNLFHDMRLTLPQKAAIRICGDASRSQEELHGNIITEWATDTSLVALFQRQLDLCQAATKTTEFLYWKKALSSLRQANHHSVMHSNIEDSLILLQPFKRIQDRKLAQIQRCNQLEDLLGPLEQSYRGLKKRVKQSISGLEELRLKLWYTSQIINSDMYMDARNVATALLLMTIPNMQMTTSLVEPVRSMIRPTSSRSTRSSIFGEPQSDTMKLLKAPTEHGGPRKLADEQIENIKSWLQQSNIDNFCTGEERLHRFCMEIQLLAKKLTGETMLHSPDLWSSDLFTRERLSYDVQSVGISSAPASTRPASVYSDAFPASYPAVRPTLRSSDSDVRSIMSDERSSVRRGSVYSLFQRSLNPQLLTPELASSISSYGRTSSANTTSDIFSLPSQSVTSASVYSRAPSILHGSLPNFGIGHTASLKEKKKFREQTRQGLVCLLLSDLGSLVWSWGCETDKWICDVQQTKAIEERFNKRALTRSLLSADEIPKPQPMRRRSATEFPLATRKLMSGVEHLPQQVEQTDSDLTYLEALRDVIIRLSKHVDPVNKLQACVDFHSLAKEQLSLTLIDTDESHCHVPFRRSSVDSHSRCSVQDVTDRLSHLDVSDVPQVLESQMIQHLKKQLATLKPMTIFRDLQFIAVFTPPEMLEKTAAGEAFMHLGMAALEYKSELCGSMVDVADQIVAADAIKRVLVRVDTDQSLSKAAEYWEIAALEGNPVAQRELAMLYLKHPEMLPVVTLPLTTSGEIFRSDMMWQEKITSDDSRQALCLALHWMQQAANKGDRIALKKLEERQELGA